MGGRVNLNILLVISVFLLGIGCVSAGQIYHVDCVNGDDDSNGLSHETAFASIQVGIDATTDGDTVIVWPGQYLQTDPFIDDEINFNGKNITLTSVDPNDPNMVKNTIIGGIVKFDGSEDPNCAIIGFNINHRHYGVIYGNDTHATISRCVISGNGPCEATVIRNCDGTISNCLITDNTTFALCGVFPVVLGCNGLIKSCTIANNASGLGDWYGNTITVENCIIYSNGEDGDPQIAIAGGGTLNICYCNVQDGLGGIDSDGTVNWGPGNIDADPCFVRWGYWEDIELIEGNYHLKSNGWRLNESEPSWTYDDVTSLCIDAGNPGSSLGNELLTVLPQDPNDERGVNLRINMGAYGGTGQASMAPYGWALLGDLSNDGIVDYIDLAGQVEGWLTSVNEQPGDLNRDTIVDMRDFADLVGDWLQMTDWAEY